MNDANDADLQAALQASAQMLEAAQAADWQQVAGLQSVCADRVQRQWPASMHARAALQLLREQHSSVLALTAQAHQAIGRELGTLRENHRALSAYLDAGGSN